MHLPAFGLCFTDESGIAFKHDATLVALSYVIAVAGSYAALEMIARWRIAQGRQSYYWQFGSAAALGTSIWSMHFIGILAIRTSFALTYSPGATLASLLIAIAVVICGMQIVRNGTSWFRVINAGITVGLGVAAMHYVGMSALRFPGSLAYTPSLWGLSLVVGIAAATAALWLSLTLQRRWQRATAAFVMGGGICGMHYIGMAAAVFTFDPLAEVSPGVPTLPLAVVVAAATLALILVVLVFVATDRRFLASEKRDAEMLRQSNLRLAQANAGLELRGQQLDAVMSNIVQGICLFDSEQRLLVCNRRYAEIYNLSLEATSGGRTLAEILDYRFAAGTMPDMPRADYLERSVKVALNREPSDSVVTLKNGRVIAIHKQPIQGGGWVAAHEDITERRQAEAKIEFMARHDALTLLPNRVLFQERLEQAVAMVGRGAGCAILCLDLDRFKIINDTLGHPIGDGVLKMAADRLHACVREGDTVARLGGDEFAILQLGVESAAGPELLAERIIAAFQDPIEVDGHQIMIGTSIGVSVAPGDGATSDALLKNADIALYLAKSEGRGGARFFEPNMDARIHMRRTLEMELAGALARNEFELHYQPLINLATGNVAAFEALLRWNHPTRGLVAPQDFIPLAEETGMIVAIGGWVLRTACFEAENWPADVGVAVNLSSVQCKEGNLVATVQAALSASGLRPDRLELEITESVLLDDAMATLTALQELRAMGITVALDDFGTGYSSLSYLRRFPFDKIKIDQCFVRDLGNKETMSIVRAVIALGRGLGMKTTAEGVETLDRLNQLRDEGCTEVQGYIASPPARASDLAALMNGMQFAPACDRGVSDFDRLAIGACNHPDSCSLKAPIPAPIG
jgi:diguanylate cyclase (GGDEF)-like protein